MQCWLKVCIGEWSRNNGDDASGEIYIAIDSDIQASERQWRLPFANGKYESNKLDELFSAISRYLLKYSLCINDFYMQRDCGVKIDQPEIERDERLCDNVGNAIARKFGVAISRVERLYP